MKKAIITGITGQDGAYLAELLLYKGYKVYGAYRRISSQNFWRIDYLGIRNHPNLILVEHDLIDAASTIRMVSEIKPDEIYNLAAQSFVHASFDQPLATSMITGIGVTHLLEAIRIINKDIKKDLRIADLQALSEYDKLFEANANLIYERKRDRRFNTDTKLTLRPFLASREEFFKGAILLENNSEYIIRDNFFFSSNLKYSLADNFDDLIYPPVDTYPAQVRSDVKEYLKNFDQGVIIGRAQFDYHLSPKKK